MRISDLSSTTKTLEFSKLLSFAWRSVATVWMGGIWVRKMQRTNPLKDTAYLVLSSGDLPVKAGSGIPKGELFCTAQNIVIEHFHVLARTLPMSGTIQSAEGPASVLPLREFRLFRSSLSCGIAVMTFGYGFRFASLRCFQKGAAMVPHQSTPADCCAQSEGWRLFATSNAPLLLLDVSTYPLWRPANPSVGLF